MRMLTEHVAEEHHHELKTGVYTWLKKKFLESMSGSRTTMEIHELIPTLLGHPKMVYQKIDINMKNVLRRMKENAHRDRVAMNSMKHM